MIASTKWTSGTTYEGKTESGNTLIFDSSAEHVAGASPMEGVLAALCGCTSVDVVSILKKKRQELSSLVVTATAEQAPEAPRVFTSIHLLYTAKGPGLSHKAVEDAVVLSKEKYCSVSIMLQQAVKISYAIAVEEDAG
jgi:putative redox protein